MIWVTAAAAEIHAFKAYRLQLNGVQCAEIAVMENDEDEIAADFVEPTNLVASDTAVVTG